LAILLPEGSRSILNLPLAAQQFKKLAVPDRGLVALAEAIQMVQRHCGALPPRIFRQHHEVRQLVLLLDKEDFDAGRDRPFDGFLV
jgi:hypothetical protein